MLGTSKSNDQHDAVPDRDDDREGHDTAWDPASDEVLDLEVALAGFWILHHDGGLDADKQT